MDKNDELKCPYCGFEDDISNFPDLFYDGCEYPKQYKLQREIQEKGCNIVTCGNEQRSCSRSRSGMCGDVFIQKLNL